MALQDLGVAQGGMIDTQDGRWFALFRDFGAVGRIPYLVPMEWKDGWPVIGIDGKVPTDSDFLTARNTLTQRTIGPVCSSEIAMETDGMKDGDRAGLCLLQQNYSLIGVKTIDRAKYI